MKELFKYYKKKILIGIIPYLLLIFLLVTPVEYLLITPGGLSEVEDLIQIDYIEDIEIEGTISTTYVMSITRPTYFQYFLGKLYDYATIYPISVTSYSDYTNAEISKISALAKEISISSAIYVAYEKAKLTDPDIVINFEEKTVVYGKSSYLDNYDLIDFGDEIIQVIGDNGYVVTDFSEVSDYTLLNSSYEWTFKNSDGELYTVVLSKDEDTNYFGITSKTYCDVDELSAYPTFNEVNSNIGGPSGGLLQTLSIYNMLVEEDLTKGLKIAGTGTIDSDGDAGYIGGVEQKIITAYINEVDIFFITSLENTTTDNYQEALRVCEEYNINPDGWLIPVSCFDDILDYLDGVDQNG